MSRTRSTSRSLAIEIHVDRIELHDGGEHLRAAGADQLADRDLARRDDAVERRHHLGVVEIDLRLLGVGLRLEQFRLGGIAVGGGIVERRLRCGLAAHQLLLTFEVRLGLDHGRLRGGFGGLRLLQSQLIRLGLDGEEVLPLLHRSCRPRM